MCCAKIWRCLLKKSATMSEDHSLSCHTASTVGNIFPTASDLASIIDDTCEMMRSCKAKWTHLGEENKRFGTTAKQMELMEQKALCILLEQ